MYYYLYIVLQLCLVGLVMLATIQTYCRRQCLNSSQWEQGGGGNALYQGHAAWK